MDTIPLYTWADEKDNESIGIFSARFSGPSPPFFYNFMR
jgi:hypothetical protein